MRRDGYMVGVWVGGMRLGLRGEEFVLLVPAGSGSARPAPGVGWVVLGDGVVGVAGLAAVRCGRRGARGGQGWSGVVGRGRLGEGGRRFAVCRFDGLALDLLQEVRLAADERRMTD